MVSVSEAIKLILTHVPQLPAVKVPIAQALGLRLAETLYAPMSIPPFDQSAMDGYAFRFADLELHGSLKVAGEVAAGDFIFQDLEEGTAVRIFTGAAVPKKADTVVVQEKARVINKRLYINDPDLVQGANIRYRGTQALKNAPVIEEKTRLRAGAIGYLAMLGITEVWVYAPPRISIIITGKELVPPGTELQPGQVYESNSFSLVAALNELYLKPLWVEQVEDNEAKITQLIARAISESDMVIITGGVSVGDYDYVPRALEACKVQMLFNKVSQKPGKPFCAGISNNCMLFGLPGNPGSVFTCFNRYIVPAIYLSMNLPYNFEGQPYLLKGNYQKKAGITMLLRGKLSDIVHVIPIKNQASYLMDSFVTADCIIEFEENKTHFEEGDMVRIHFLLRTMV